MEFVCPICQSLQKHSLSETARDWDDLATYQIYECPSCHLQRTNPFPDDINTANTNNVWSQAPDPFNRFLKGILNTLEIKNIERTTGLKKILDIGPGYGEFSETAYKMGYDVVAADSFEGKPYCLQNLPTIPYYHFSWETNRLNHADAAAGRTVILRHVLEHVNDPLKFLDSFIQNKVDSFYIAVPNYARPERKILKDYDLLWGFPQHLWHFDIISLRVLCQRLNCQILRWGHTTIPTVNYSILLYVRRKFPKWVVKILDNRLVATMLMPLQIFFPNNVVWLVCKVNR